MGERIGQAGAFGYAQLATRKSDGQVVAVKIIPKKNIQKNQIPMMRDELFIMRSLNHPNIINAIEAFENKSKLYLVMEACTGGEVFDHILGKIQARQRNNLKGSYSEHDASGVLKQIFQGLAYLHEHKIAHRDLKPDNFLMLNNSPDSPVKIIDFGLARFSQSSEHFNDFTGTPQYCAPEVFNRDYTLYCDLWSMGVVMYAMLFGSWPFSAKTQPKVDENGKRLTEDQRLGLSINAGFQNVVREGNGNWFPADIPVSAAARDLMARLMELNPTDRITCEEALAHPWFHGEATSVPLVEHVFHNLSNMAKASKMKTLFLSAVCKQAFTRQEQKSLRNAFRELDVNGDGKLTLEEISQVLTNSGDAKANEHVQALFKLGDVDSDGQLSYNEMLLAVAQTKLIEKEDRLHAMFEQIDKNHDGVLTPQEITAVLGDVPGLDKMIAEVDTDHNGTLDYHEFVHIFLNTAEDDHIDEVLQDDPTAEVQ